MIEITSLDHNGKGIGRLNNKIVFVENALPNEIVEINITNEKKNYLDANVKNFIKKSKDRIESKCPFFLNCGGCDLLHLNYENTLNFKQNKIENIINKYLKNNIKVNKIVKCDNNFYYRNKTTFHVKEKIGFYKNKSYDIILIDNCLISSKLINNCIKFLQMLELKLITKIICRSSENELMIIIETNYEDIDITPLKQVANSIYIKNNNKYKLIYGQKYITEKIGNYKYLVSPDSFFQININICYKLYSKIKEYIGINNNVLDLYCGTGSISIFVSDYNNVLGIEINKYAINDAKENAKLNNVKNINFICGESEKEMENMKFNPDVVIVDPPRMGLSKNTIKNIFKIHPKKLIYVSCDPMTFVRDLNILKERYNIIEITPFDMFPNTKHVECLCLLSLK